MGSNARRSCAVRGESEMGLPGGSPSLPSPLPLPPPAAVRKAPGMPEGCSDSGGGKDDSRFAGRGVRVAAAGGLSAQKATYRGAPAPACTVSSASGGPSAVLYGPLTQRTWMVPSLQPAASSRPSGL